jgi:predicted nucleic acid-binding Zn ribbon protein
MEVAMIIQDPRLKTKCPECGSENVKSKLSFTNIVSWAGRILGVPTVKIWEKRCEECGHEFQVFRK